MGLASEAAARWRKTYVLKDYPTPLTVLQDAP